ncbi:MAG: hypothetical protein Fur006_57530 [Coleofasciculaceae cyanobacterium]
MPIPSLTETIIRDRTTDKVYQRGEQYYQSGAVANICQRGDTIQANVEGNEVEPYRINIQFDSGGIKKVSCTCAYEMGGGANILLPPHWFVCVNRKPSTSVPLWSNCSTDSIGCKLKGWYRNWLPKNQS